ncbi:hypothetical protein HYALB_00002758 [Hymenoscyphus albidus]|uniref:Saccharopine dehydrogenase NADP binding domain-containing protein n=1 Tax=Hymenoscyphus albidus TaxID=595503 RepID=A0A9N9LKC7_9HELO|nr:hypothetical protein HYALB_00002758 [Hymenoscyphus albidus]
MSTSRVYDLVVLGASGYTGKLTAEYIAKNFPTDIRWALAGRSANKLEDVAAECKSIDADRSQPAIETCSLDSSELNALAKKTTILLTTIGPYSVHGEHAFKACADNGTHYLDITGEVVWHNEMIKKYERTAKANGSIMIPQIGLDSAPADMVVWSIVELIREKFSAPTGEVILSAKFPAVPSGGTLSSVFSIFDVYSFKELQDAGAPYALSPIPGPAVRDPVPLKTKLFGFRSVRDLGMLTTYFFARADIPQVHRSWGLLGGPSGYGPNFHFSEYAKSQNYLTAIASHFTLLFGSILVAIPFARTILKKTVVQPGDGPSKEESRNHVVEYKAIGNPDVKSENPARAWVKATYAGSGYQLTAVIAASATLTLLRDEHKLEGGIHTPATLGQKFLDRMEEGGFKFEKGIYEN